MQSNQNSTPTTTIYPGSLTESNIYPYKEVVQYLDFIKNYSIADIQYLLSVAVDREEKAPIHGKQRYPTALASLCFSTIEDLGLLLRGDLFETGFVSNSDIRALYKTIDNAHWFFLYAQSKGLTVCEPSLVKAIYILFRHNVTYNLCPQLSLGLFQNKSNNLSTLIIEIRGIPNLNVNSLADYVIKGFDHLVRDVLDPKNLQFVEKLHHQILLLENAEEQILKRRYKQEEDTFPGIRQHLKQILPTFNFDEAN